MSMKSAKLILRAPNVPSLTFIHTTLGTGPAFFKRLIAVVSDRKAFCLINSNEGVNNNTPPMEYEPGNSCKRGLIKSDDGEISVKTTPRIL